jgi:hypothetical protein
MKATTAEHLPQLAAGIPGAPTVEILCHVCGQPQRFEDVHAGEIGTSPLDTCTRCDEIVHLVCTICGTRFKPRPAYRTPAWLR